jgi:hypothetical protein
MSFNSAWIRRFGHRVKRTDINKSSSVALLGWRGVCSAVVMTRRPIPARADIEMTRVIVEVAKPLGISVHDHIIVGKEGHASFKGLKLI